jgi:hypothetical protein
MYCPTVKAIISDPSLRTKIKRHYKPDEKSADSDDASSKASSKPRKSSTTKNPISKYQAIASFKKKQEKKQDDFHKKQDKQFAQLLDHLSESDSDTSSDHNPRSMFQFSTIQDSIQSLQQSVNSLQSAANDSPSRNPRSTHSTRISRNRRHEESSSASDSPSTQSDDDSTDMHDHNFIQVPATSWVDVVKARRHGR